MPRRFVSFLRVAFQLCLFAVWVVGHAAVSQAEDSATGLRARLTSGEQTVNRIDPQIQFSWNDASPDERLSAERFTAVWTGTFLIPAPGEYRFHFFVQGEVRLTIDGKPVTGGELAEPGWIAGEAVSLDGRDVPIEVKFVKTAPGAVVRMFWTGPGFSIEPVPQRVLECDGDSVLQTRETQFANGTELYSALLCGNCHTIPGLESTRRGPSLEQAGVTISREWFSDWLIGSGTGREERRMPHFALTPQDAADISQALVQSTKFELPIAKAPENVAESEQRGQQLFHSLGCLACHTVGKEGTRGRWSGGALDSIGDKRSVDWLAHWLATPESLNRDHRMPVFPLSEEERLDLAGYLAARRSRSGDAAAKTVGDTKRGLELIRKQNCVACHRLPDALAKQIPQPPARPLDVTRLLTDASCIVPADRRPPNQPRYLLGPDDRRDLTDYLKGRQSTAREAGAATRLLTRNGCIACHERDGGVGFKPVIAHWMASRSEGKVAGESLLPPNLTAVGDKLRDEWLARAVAGEQPRRLPWLSVRMPKFRHTEEERAMLVKHFIAYDRIPPNAPDADVGGVLRPPADLPIAQVQQAGLALGGARGFSCVACHKVAKFEPRGVAQATRGSDLYRIDERMRPEFFSRWVKSPLRISPGMEMPSFQRPAPNLLGERLDAQLAAVWHVLSDPGKPPAFDTSSVEQSIEALVGGPPAVVRDVFNVGDAAKSDFVPRSLAIGFDNRANVLIDLDRFALRGWWSGSFARQRASGKSWYWEPAGVNFQQTPNEQPDLLLETDAAPPLSAVQEHGRYGRLENYRTRAGEVELTYSLMYLDAGVPIRVRVVEVLRPLVVDDDDFYPRSWKRSVRVMGVPAAGKMLLTKTSIGETGHLLTWRILLKKSGGDWTGEAVYRLERETGGKVSSTATVVGRQAADAPRSPGGLQTVDGVPGFEGVRLPLPASIMPTSLTFLADGTLAFCTLKGQVYLARDTDGDGVPDRLTLVEEGLASPFGLIADGDDLIVAHKPELLRLRDLNGDGRADVRTVIADGWGYTDDYHDWTTGIVRDSAGRLYIGLGSDYAKAGRTSDQGRLRGKVVRVEQDGSLTVLGHEFRYPTGLAITSDDQVFVSDNQGVQNPFNEINHLVDGARYGVPSLFEELHTEPPRPPAIQIPHPWTRSVNGLFFLNADRKSPFYGHGVGCEYDTRFLVRFTVEPVGATYQGAVYPLSLPPTTMLQGTKAENANEPLNPAGSGSQPKRGFLGTFCGAQAPNGDLYIGSMHDSGWTGGPNIGEIVRLKRSGEIPLGIESISAREGKFIVRFTRPMDTTAAARPERYAISGVTRRWTSGYATPDSGQHRLEVTRADVSDDGRTVTLQTGKQQRGFVYEIRVGAVASDKETSLWPAVGYYTLHDYPVDPDGKR